MVTEPVDTKAIVADERHRISEIAATGKAFNMEDAANRAIADGSSLDQFRKIVLDSKARSSQVEYQPPVEAIGMSKKEKKEYSLFRAIQLAALGKPLDGLERECSDELAQQISKPAKGFYVPPEVVNMRGNVAGDAAKGGNLIDTDLRIGSMVSELHDAMVLPKLGVKMLHGLTGNVVIPTDDGGINTYWLQENGEPSVSEFSIGQLAMRPHTVGSLINLSRELLLQTGNWVEGFVRSKLMRSMGLEIQRAALLGSGSSNQPTGLLNALTTSQIVAIATNGGAPLLKHLIALETKVADANADFGTMAYLTNSVMFGQLKQTPEFAEAFTRPILKVGSDNSGEMNGYRTYRTNQIPKDLTKGTSSNSCSAILFGNFSSLAIGFWAGLDIVVDRATGYAAGQVNVRALQSCDVAVTRKESFAAIKDAKVTA
ncbi:MAG: phage major capsid protein [Hyphomicrobiales bacterium]|nr:phage major capsid protein [Hyphomicrobiales bacterium]